MMSQTKNHIRVRVALYVVYVPSYTVLHPQATRQFGVCFRLSGQGRSTARSAASLLCVCTVCLEHDYIVVVCCQYVIVCAGGIPAMRPARAATKRGLFCQRSRIVGGGSIGNIHASVHGENRPIPNVRRHQGQLGEVQQVATHKPPRHYDCGCVCSHNMLCQSHTCQLYNSTPRHDRCQVCRPGGESRVLLLGLCQTLEDTRTPKRTCFCRA